MKLTSTYLPLRTLLSKLWLLLALATTTVACDKSEPKPVDEEEIPADERMFNRLITVNNFGEALPQGSEPTTKQSPVYYSLEQNKAINPDFKQTKRWDMSFSDIYRSFLNCNTATNGGTGKGGILIVKQKFEDVVEIPADNLFRRGEKAYGTDDSGAFGEGLGWYLYDFAGNIRGGSDPQKRHVCYPIENHTLIVRTANGHYAKVKIISIYKDQLDPAEWTKDSPTPYYTFQYVLAKAGSTKFEISK